MRHSAALNPSLRFRTHESQPNHTACRVHTANLHLPTHILEENIMAAKISYIPKDYNSVTPYLIIRGAAQAIDYYKKVFGATETMRMPGPDGKIGHAELKIGNSHIILADENPSMGVGHTSAATVGGSPVSLYVYLPNVDEVVKRATTEGAKLLKPVQDQFYGDRTGFIQ